MTWRRALVVIGWLLVGALSAVAQSYPTKPITIVVPAAPGGVSDTLARAIAQHLSEVWPQQIVVENRGGANHQIGTAAVGKATPDGHTLLLAAETIFVINPSLYGKLPYDAEKDFAPVTGLVRANQALLAHPGFAAKSVGELIALARQQPGTISYATSGIGSAAHVNIALLESMAGVKLVPVHYRGMAPAVNDVIGGHVTLTSVAVSSAIEPWRGGLVRMLAIGSPQRLPQLPDVPTAAESGVPGYEAVTWFGLFTTGGTPHEVIGVINAQVRRIFDDAAFRARFITPSLYEVMTGTPEQFAGFVRRETQRWARVLRDANMKVD